MPTATEQKTGAEKVAEFLGGRPARGGAELVKALRLSGTPDDKLADARALLAAGREAGRVPTAAEVLAAMEAEGAGTSPGTLVKARAIVAGGKIRPPARAALAVEDARLAEAPAADGRKAADPKK